MINEELQKQVVDCFNQYIELQEQAEKDYNNVKAIIEQSDKILEKYEQKYNKQIASKDEEIRLLEEELKRLKQETTMY